MLIDPSQGLLESLTYIKNPATDTSINPTGAFFYGFVLCSDKGQKEDVDLTNGGLYSTTDCSTSVLQPDSHQDLSHKNRTGTLTNTKKS